MPFYNVHHRQDTKLNEEQQQLKQALVDSGSEWSTTWHNILVLDPAYFKAYVRLRNVPINNQHLSRKIQELVLLAVDASCTHLWESGIRVHTAAALRAGASKEEIMETLECASVLGVHSMSVGVPLLLEVLEEKGMQEDTPLSAHQEKIREDFKATRGYWHGTWEAILKLDPDFMAAYKEFSSVPFQEKSHNHLDAKTRELIYCAIDCATTHLYQPGLKLHIRNAIDQGATQEEVMEVFELAALMGVHTVMKGGDVLTDELLAGSKS